MGHGENQVFFTGFNISNTEEAKLDLNFSAGVRDFLDENFDDIEPVKTGLFVASEMGPFLLLEWRLDVYQTKSMAR
jgi:hypothetical protein